MNKFTELAHEIIDMVEERIRELYPDIEIIASEVTDEDGEFPNTLLFGDDYYSLEDDIANLIKDKITLSLEDELKELQLKIGKDQKDLQDKQNIADIYETLNPRQKNYVRSIISWWIKQAEIDLISKIINGNPSLIREGILWK